MATQISTTQIDDPRAADRTRAARGSYVHLQNELRRIASKTDDWSQQCELCLNAIQQLPDVAACGILLPDSAGTLSLAWHQFTGPIFTRSVYQNALLQSAAHALENNVPQILPASDIRNLTTLCFPTDVPEFDRGILAVAISKPAPELSSEMLIPQIAAQHLSNVRLNSHQQQLDFEVNATSAILELTTDIKAATDLRSAVYALANGLQNHLQCEQVAIGLQKHGTVRLQALSGQSQFNRRTEVVHALEAAFAETVLRDDVSSFPTAETGRHCSLAHGQLADLSRADSIVSCPLKSKSGTTIGVATIVGSAPEMSGRQLHNLADCLIEPAGSALELVRRAEGNWLKRMLFASKTEDGIGWRRATGLVVATALMAMFIPVPYRVKTDCLIEPVSRRFSVAPHDGLLQITHAQPGDIVTAGELLAEMDGREIDWELAGLAAEQHKAARERDTFMMNKSIPEAQLARLEMERLSVKSELLNFRRSHLEIRSPLDGIVLTGSLDRRENYPVKTGDALYEIAPLDTLRVELAVIDDDISYVQPGMEVTLTFDGMGSDSVSAQVNRIRPRSEVRDGENVFIADVDIPNASGDLRPGMRGTARVYSAKRTIGWTLFHKPWEHLVNWLRW